MSLRQRTEGSTPSSPTNKELIGFFEATKDSPDGRATAGHFALLEKLKDDGLLEALVCFDGETPTADWDTRDANMAKNIIANLADSTTLVVVGNLHTQVEPITFDD